MKFAFASFLTAGLLLTTAVSAAPVTLPYTQNFQSTAPSADATVSYPDFTYTLQGGTATVDAGGVLHLNPFINPDPQILQNSDQLAMVTPTPVPVGQDITISADIGASASDGNYNVGFTIGQNNVVFHPGYGGAALRADGPNGFGNTNVGFTPANGVLHHLTVVSHPSGLFDITLKDGQSGQTYSTSFTNINSYGGSIGLYRSGGPQGDGQYDNFSITAVPEPAALGLLSLGGLLLSRRNARR